MQSASSAQNSVEPEPFISNNAANPTPPSPRRSLCSWTDSMLDLARPPELSRLALDRRTSNSSAVAGDTTVPGYLFSATAAGCSTCSSDAAISHGTRQKKLERLQVETLCRFLVAAAGSVHALQAERGASVAFIASFGQTMHDKLPAFHEATDRKLSRLGNALAMYKDVGAPNMDSLQPLRQAVGMRSRPYSEVISTYTVLVRALLDTMAIASRPLQQTEVMHKTASLLVFQQMKEAAALQRGIVAGITASGQLAIDPSLHYMLLSNLANLDAFSMTFKMLVDQDMHSIYQEHLANMPSMIVEFETRLRTSKQDTEAMLMTVRPESWFACNTERMDGLIAIEKRVVASIEETARIVCHNQELALQSQSIPGSPTMSQPHSPSWSRGSRPDSPRALKFQTPFAVDSLGIIGKALNIPLQQLSMAEKIGGSTYTGSWNGSVVAIKMFTEACVGGQSAMMSILSDLSEQARFRHPNICGIYGVSLAPDRYHLVMEYMDLGSLWHQLHSEKSSISFFDVATQIARGLQYLHDMAGHVHAELTSSSVLSSSCGMVKIKTVTARKTKEARKHSWRYYAPEIFLEDCWTFASDIFSLGILMWELLTKEMPYATYVDADADLQEWICAHGYRPPIPHQAPEAIAHLITQCWDEDATRRPSAAAVLEALDRFLTALVLCLMMPPALFCCGASTPTKPWSFGDAAVPSNGSDTTLLR
eukprot:jgi/Tetstr1/428235/TSEL_018275.t1